MEKIPRQVCGWLTYVDCGQRGNEVCAFAAAKHGREIDINIVLRGLLSTAVVLRIGRACLEGEESLSQGTNLLVVF